MNIHVIILICFISGAFTSCGDSTSVAKMKSNLIELDANILNHPMFNEIRHAEDGKIELVISSGPYHSFFDCVKYPEGGAICTPAVGDTHEYMKKIWRGFKRPTANTPVQQQQYIAPPATYYPIPAPYPLQQQQQQ